MVATATIRDNIAGAVNAPAACPSTVTNLRYREVDNNNQDLCNPVTIPACGTKFSFWKSNFAEFTATFTQICNLNWFVTSFNWTGTTLWIGDGVQAKTSAASAGYDPAVGLNVLTVHDTIAAATNAGTTYTNSGSGRAITISEAGAVINAANETSDYFITNIELTTSAVSGTQTARTVTLEYDEI